MAPELSERKAAPLQVLRDAVKANKLLVSAAKGGMVEGRIPGPAAEQCRSSRRAHLEGRGV